MSIQIKVDRAAFKRQLTQYAKAESKKIKDVIIQDVAGSCARELALQTVPFGLSASVGDRFEKSVAKQVFKGAMRQSGKSVRDAHREARDGKGRVSGRLRFVKGHPNFANGGEELIQEKKQKVGTLKAAWLVAYSKIPNVKAFKRIPRWIKRHSTKTSIGNGSLILNPFRTIIKLTNKMEGADNVNVKVQTALKFAYRKSYKYMERILKKRQTL